MWVFKGYTDLPQTSIRINLSLWPVVQEQLLSDPKLQDSIRIRLNSTFRQRVEGYFWIHQQEGVETVQEVDFDAVLEQLLTIMGDFRPRPLGEVAKSLNNWVAEPVAKIKDYLLHLIEKGMLEWAWPLRHQPRKWLELGSIHLEKISGQEGQRFRYVCDSMLNTLGMFANTNGDVRKLIQKDAQDTLLLLGMVSPLRLEDTFFEDIAVSELPNWAEQEQDKIKQSIKQLISHLPTTSRTEGLWSFFKSTYAPGERVALMDLYLAYYRSVSNRDGTDIQQPGYEDTSGPEDQVGMISNKLLQEDGIVKFLMAENPERTGEEQYWSALVQPICNGAVPLAYIDHIDGGYGTQVSRFLDLFPEDLTSNLRDINAKRQSDDLILAELRAGGYFNANLRPPLLPYRIELPGSWWGRDYKEEVQQLLRLDQLFVTEEEGGLKLRHANGKEVQIVDTSIQARSSRNSLFRFLLLFGPDLPGLAGLKAQLSKAFRNRDQEGILRLPRIYFGDHLVLMRKKWYVPKELLPLPVSNEEGYPYFRTIQSWKEKMGLPRWVFLTVHAPNVLLDGGSRERMREDDYKPVFIDLDHPIWVRQLPRLFRRVPNLLLIEEMLPDPESLLTVSGEPHAFEAVLFNHPE